MIEFSFHYMGELAEESTLVIGSNEGAHYPVGNIILTVDLSNTGCLNRTPIIATVLIQFFSAVK